jgi:hypothetical protein
MAGINIRYIGERRSSEEEPIEGILLKVNVPEKEAEGWIAGPEGSHY